MALAGGGGYEGKHSKGLPGPQNITKSGNVIEVPTVYNYSIGGCLAGVGGEPS